MDKTIEERVNQISLEVSTINSSIVKLWEMHASGIPPHKKILTLMAVIIAVSIITSILSLVSAVGIFLSLKQDGTFYTFMTQYAED